MNTSNFREILDTILRDRNISGTVVGYSNILNDIYDTCNNRIKNKINNK